MSRSSSKNIDSVTVPNRTVCTANPCPKRTATNLHPSLTEWLWLRYCTGAVRTRTWIRCGQQVNMFTVWSPKPSVFTVATGSRASRWLRNHILHNNKETCLCQISASLVIICQPKQNVAWHKRLHHDTHPALSNRSHVLFNNVMLRDSDIFYDFSQF